jgi:hypothetical protein
MKKGKISVRLGLFCLTVFCAVTVTGCIGKSKLNTGSNTALMAVGEETVSYHEAEAYLYFLKCQYETGMGKDIWSFELSEGETLEAYAKESLISYLSELKIICQEAVAEEVSLSEEECYEAGQRAKELLLSATEEDIERFALSEEVLTTVYEDNALADKFYNVTTALADTSVSDEEAEGVTLDEDVAKGLSEEEKLAAKKEALIEKRRDTLFREKYQEWSKKYKVVVSTTLWEEISFTH